MTSSGVDAFAGSAGGCISMGNFDANDSFDYSGALGRALDADIPVTFYYGKTDTVSMYYMSSICITSTILIYEFCFANFLSMT